MTRSVVSLALAALALASVACHRGAPEDAASIADSDSPPVAPIALNEVAAISPGPGGIWVATSAGIIVLDPISGTFTLLAG